MFHAVIIIYFGSLDRYPATMDTDYSRPRLFLTFNDYFYYNLWKFTGNVKKIFGEWVCEWLKCENKIVVNYVACDIISELTMLTTWRKRDGIVTRQDFHLKKGL
jgi:hypothetical protein